jgi:glycosyltransferase involved in cell wall biosynthesis
MYKLSVIIPAYNEENRITATLLEVSEFLKKQPFASEIFVVNDGSKDTTAQVVLNLISKLPNLKLIDNAVNMGKGWAVKKGMLLASGDGRLFMDADNSTSITHLPKMVNCLSQGYDIVIGSIEQEGAKINEQAQWYRRTFGHWSKYLIRIVAGLWEIKDTQRGFKLFDEKAAKDIFNNLTINRFGFDIEVLAIAKKRNYKIKELPVVWNNREGSTISLRSYISVFIELIKIRFNLWFGTYDK